MKLFQALKEKQRLVSDLSTIKNRLAQNNQIIAGNVRNYNPVDLMEEYDKKVLEILDLKKRIQKANQEIYPKIFFLNELKGQISFLAGVPCKDGKEIEGGRFSGDPHEVVYHSIYSRIALDKIIRDKTKRSRELQDEIDIYNHTIDV